MVNTASKGRRLEHEVRKMLEADGWDVVRGAASKGRLGGYDSDLIATRKTARMKREVGVKMFQMIDQNGDAFDLLALQCKANKA